MCLISKTVLHLTEKYGQNLSMQFGAMARQSRLCFWGRTLRTLYANNLSLVKVVCVLVLFFR